MPGVAQVTVREDHSLGIEVEIPVNSILLRQVNFVYGIGKALSTAAFLKKENMFGLSPNPEEGVSGERSESCCMLRLIVETVIAHFKQTPMPPTLLLFFLIFVEGSTGVDELLQTGSCGAISDNVKVIYRDTVS